MAGQLTQDWIGIDFLPSQIVQAVGQSFGLTSLVWFFLHHLEPSEVLHLRRGAADRAVVRGAIGSRPSCRPSPDARTGVFEPRRAACHDGLDGDRQRLQRVRAGRGGTLGWSGRGECARNRLLAQSVADQANVLAYIDGFMVIGFAAIGVLLLMLLLRQPPGLPNLAARTGSPAQG